MSKAPYVCFVTKDDFDRSNSVEHFEYEPSLEQIGPKCWAFDGYVLVRYEGELKAGFGGEWNIIAKSDDEEVEVLYFKAYHRSGGTIYYRSALKEFNGDTEIQVVPLTQKYADASFTKEEDLREELESTAEENAVLLGQIADLREKNLELIGERHTNRNECVILQMENKRLEKKCEDLQAQVDGGHELLDKANANIVKANTEIARHPRMIRANNEIATLLTEVDRLKSLDNDRVKEWNEVAMQNELIKKRNRKLLAETDNLMRRDQMFKDYLEYQAVGYYDDIGKVVEALRRVASDIDVHLNLHGVENDVDKALCLDLKRMAEKVVAETVNLDTLEAYRKLEFFYDDVSPDSIIKEYHLVPGEPFPTALVGLIDRIKHQTLVTLIPYGVYIFTGKSVDRLETTRYKIEEERVKNVTDLILFGKPVTD